MWVDRIFNVECCYQHGIGVKKDTKKAFEYYQKSAGIGHANGIYHLEHYYEMEQELKKI